jgi:hypothetical protein
MDWLLLVLIFDISNGSIKLVSQETRPFRTEATCNREGAKVRSVRNETPDVRRMSLCIPKAAFNESFRAKAPT